jgi:hypothetical protein
MDLNYEFNSTVRLTSADGSNSIEVPQGAVLTAGSGTIPGETPPSALDLKRSAAIGQYLDGKIRDPILKRDDPLRYHT